MCDCFLDVACYCLEINDRFIAFQKRCLKKKKYRDILLFAIVQKEDDLVFFQQSLLFVAKHLATFKYNYL